MDIKNFAGMKSDTTQSKWKVSDYLKNIINRCNALTKLGSKSLP